MAILRLSNGGDVAVDLGVEDTIAAVSIGSGASEFIELPGKEGPVHVRPGSVIAVLESVDHKTTGFRTFGAGAAAGR